jgi:hypothetical protein
MILYLIAAVLIIVFICWFNKMDRKQTENFTIDNVGILSQYKSITPEDFVKRFGGQEKVVDIFFHYQIPIRYTMDPKFYPQIASYLYNSGLQI